MMASKPSTAEPVSTGFLVDEKAEEQFRAPRLKRAVHFAVLSGARAILRDSYHRWVFAKIWSENRWGDLESRSGPGSNLRETEHLRQGLSDLLEGLCVRSVLDLPCGDFHWMKELHLPAGTTYLGGDIVERLIERNRNAYASEMREFRILNLLRDRLPKADLILCRDALVHFSFSDIFAAIANVRLSGSEYLLTTHYRGDRKNREIRTGQWRPLNLTRSPFHFPPPLLVVDEKCGERGGTCRDKGLALWRIDALPERF
jgi:SAM-dependent methyltransferase